MAHQPKAYKKFVASAATATLVATAIVPVASAATSFKDVSKTYEEAVNYLVENGIAKGTTETTFGTTSNISRGDAAVMIANALKLDTATAPDAGFQDVNARVAGAVNAIVEAKIANGKTATAFAPADYITRQEMAKMLANAYELEAKENANFKDVNSNWIGYVSALKEAGITLGKTDTTFAPTDNLTRGEFALFVFRAEGMEPVSEAPSVDSVSAIANTVVEITLNNEVKSAKKEQFSIKGSDDKELEIKDVFVSEDGGTIELKTAEQTPASIYTLSVNGQEYKFVGMVKDSTNPEVTSAVATKNNKVSVTFNEDVNRTALNAANYSIDGLQVLSAEYKLDAYGDPVKNSLVLTTAPQKEGTIYKLVVSNVQDINGNVVDSSKDEVLFGGIAKDTVAPRLGSAVAVSNIHVELRFNEELSKASAEAISNYTIPGLTVLKAELSADKTTVTLTTSAQTEGTIYKLTATNVADEDGNTIDTSYDEAQFGGVAPDKTNPELLGAVATTNTKVSLTFNEKLDKASAQNVANYSIPGVTVTGAKLNSAGTTVTLTTTAQTEGTIYKVTVANVTDLFGNVINSSRDEFQFGGLGADTTRPTLVSAQSANGGQVVNVVFSEKLDSKTANMPQNYYLGTELGYALKAELQADGVTVKLTTKQQNAKVYTLDVTGVADESGNVISEDADEIKFAGQGSTDTTAPRVVSAVAVNKNTVRVTFNEQVDVSGADAADFTLTLADGTAVAAGLTNPTAIKRTTDKLSVTLQWDDADSFTSGTIYKLTVGTDVVDLSGNAVSATTNNSVQFAGSSAVNPAPSASAAVAINNKTLRITFSEPINVDNLVHGDISIVAQDGSPATDLAGVSSTHELSADGRTLTVYLDSPTLAGEIYNVTFSDNVYDELEVAEADYTKVVSFAGVGTATSAPKVSAAVAVNNDTLEVTFDKKVKPLTAGDFSVVTANGTRTATDVVLDAAGTKATVYFADADADVFAAGTVYTLNVAVGALVNMNGDDNTEIVSSQFAGTSKVNAAPAILDAKYVADPAITDNVVLTFSENVEATAFASYTINGNAATAINVVDNVVTLKFADADIASGLNTLTYNAGTGDTVDLNGKEVVNGASIQFVK